MHVNTLKVVVILFVIHFADDSVIDEIIQIDFDAVSMSALMINTSVDAVQSKSLLIFM